MIYFEPSTFVQWSFLIISVFQSPCHFFSSHKAFFCHPWEAEIPCWKRVFWNSWHLLRGWGYGYFRRQRLDNADWRTHGGCDFSSKPVGKLLCFFWALAVSSPLLCHSGIPPTQYWGDWNLPQNNSFLIQGQHFYTDQLLKRNVPACHTLARMSPQKGAIRVFQPISGTPHTNGIPTVKWRSYQHQDGPFLGVSHNWHPT